MSYSDREVQPEAKQLSPYDLHELENHSARLFNKSSIFRIIWVFECKKVTTVTDWTLKIGQILVTVSERELI